MFVVVVLTPLLLFAVRPEVLPVPRSGVIKVVAGEPAELQCEVTQGSPRPEITWKRKVGGEGGDNLIAATYTARL